MLYDVLKYLTQYAKRRTYICKDVPRRLYVSALRYQNNNIERLLF